jgi:N-acetylglucosamine-6-phosphate deacetylase
VAIDRMIRGRLEPGGQVRDIQIGRGVIAGIVPPADPPEAALTGEPAAIASEAFFDLQVNGFAGTDFNRPGLTGEELLRAARAMWAHGIGQFLPTVITASVGAMALTLATIRRAREEGGILAHAIPGIHLEGPFLCPQDGPRGAHPRAHICDPDWDTFCRFQDAAGGLICLVTLAPERPGALDLIQRLRAAGVVVAIGHCDATEADIDAAVQAGAQLSTHLGNGAHAVLPRHRNYVQKQLATDGLLASIIVDGHHLTEYFVKNVVRCKAPERVILITDAMAAAAAPPGIYRLGEVLAEAQPDGAVRLPGTPYLAGSALTMDRAVDNVRRFAEIPLAQALAMATQHPRLLWPDAPGGLAPGAPADIVLLRDSGQFEVLETILAGETVYRAHDPAFA